MNYLKSTFMLLLLCFSSVLVMAQDDDLIHRYKFDGNLDDAVDVSHGVVAEISPGELTFIEGHDGTPDGAVDFVDTSGNNYMIYVGDWSAAEEGAPGELTITFWALWHGSTGSYQDIINKRTNYSPEAMMWGINQHFSNGEMLSCVRQSGGGPSSAVCTETALPLQEWAHVAIVLDNTNATFYLNGENREVHPYELGTGTDAMIHMGCAVNNDPYAWRPQDFYNGALDDVRFYSRVLDADEISDIYNAVGIDDKSVSNPVLTRNYPNPFNGSTTIKYSLTRNTRTEIVVYDLLGHKLATLVDEFRQAGTHTVVWDASGLPAGVYMYQLKTDDFIVSKKMKLIN